MQPRLCWGGGWSGWGCKGAERDYTVSERQAAHSVGSALHADAQRETAGGCERERWMKWNVTRHWSGMPVVP
jgi:hypothetical protein